MMLISVWNKQEPYRDYSLNIDESLRNEDKASESGLRSDLSSREIDEPKLEDFLFNFFATEERELSCEKCGDKSALAKVYLKNNICW